MKINTISTAVLSVAMILGFGQCKQQGATTSTQESVPVAVSGLKIAFIDVDSLILNYAFYQDLSEELLRKEENYRLVLTEEANKFQKEVDEFNRKIQNNVFSSQERAQQESNRLEKKRQSIDEKSVKYSNELDLENRQNSQQVSEAIDTYVKEYNKTHGFNLILTRSSLVYADDVMNITAEILEGLNAEYKSSNK
ncbi:MAG: OmpH family outer membrane protein [Bacteroidaceae bacterium]|nr:OmpH family outer membrane protein [Bacteroidaceae bacterium]